MSTENKAALPGGEVNQDFTSCPYWGQGGRYVVDLETGRRVPVKQEDIAVGAAEAVAAAEGQVNSEKPAPAEEDQGSIAIAKTVKGNNRG